MRRMFPKVVMTSLVFLSTFGFGAPTDFSLENLRQLNLRPAGQLVADAAYVPQPTTDPAYYLNYINAARINLNGWLYFVITPGVFSIDPVSGYYVAPTMGSLAQSIYLASRAYYTVTPNGGGAVANISAPSAPAPQPPPHSSGTVFSAAHLSSWAGTTASEFRGFLANESAIQQPAATADETTFLNFFNTKLIALQQRLITQAPYYTLNQLSTSPATNFNQMSFFPAGNAISFAQLQSRYQLLQHTASFIYIS